MRWAALFPVPSLLWALPYHKPTAMRPCNPGQISLKLWAQINPSLL
jgi:hypothetical protein